MAHVVYSRGKRKAEFQRLEDGRCILDVEKGVKVSERHNEFKDEETMMQYLDWLFDGRFQVMPS